MGSTLKPGGERIVIDNYKSVFVQGAYNLGGVLQNFEIITAGFNPGMFVDPGAATVGTEMQVTIGATTSVMTIGVAEADFGIIASCATAYAAGDSAPIILWHWNPGALLRNLMTVNPGGDVPPYSFYDTTSGASGKFKLGSATGVNIRGIDFILNAATDNIVGWIEQLSP